MPNEYGRLQRVVLCPPSSAFGGEDTIRSQWQALNFSGAPDLARACDEYRALRDVISSTGASVDEYRVEPGLTLDAIYVRDAAVVTPRGAVLCRMGKAARRGEPAALGRLFNALGVGLLGTIEPPGLLEGGDVVWFDDRTVAVGRGYRTNDNGIAQLRALLDDVELVVVPLPHYRGPTDVFHLMSILSPVDRDLAVVYSPLMPVPFREWLIARGMTLVEVPDNEFASMGSNVLAIAPRVCVTLAGNPITRSRLETAGAHVLTYEGSEISQKGGGGPTCLSQPLSRGLT